MPTGYRKGGVDFEDLFAPDIIGDGPICEKVKKGGVPLKFANIIHGSKGPDVGIREGGVDISNKWAAAGTVSYLDPDALPSLMEDLASAPSGPVTATVAFYFNRNGSMTLDPTTYGPRDWRSPNVPDFGDDYEIRFTQTATNGSGTLTGPLGSWLQINAARGLNLSITRSIAGSVTASRTVLVEIRAIGGSTILYSHSITMDPTADIS